MGTLESGRHTEQLALNHLKSAGLGLIARNFSCKVGEIDLIMRDHSTLQRNILVFIEVRYRRSNSHGGAAASVTHVKRQRLARTAKRFLQSHRRYARWPCRFDVIAIEGELENPAIHWIQAAFSV